MTSKTARKTLPLTVILFLLLWAILLKCLAPNIFLGDSAELTTGAAVLAVPHSPSFPLFCLSAHTFVTLPLGSLAWRVSLASAFFLILGALCFNLALWRPSRSLTIFACGTLCTVFLPFNWFQGMRAEVYALNLFLFGLLIHILKISNLYRHRYSLLSLCIGLAFANHYLLALVYGGVMFLFLVATASAKVFRLKTLFIALAVLVLGLSLYLYLPLRAARKPMLNWNNPSSLSNLTRALLRREHRGRFFAFGLLNARLKIWGGFFYRHFGFPGLVLILGSVWLALKRRESFWQLLFLIIILNGLTFIGHSNFRADHPDIWGYAMLGLTGGLAFLFYALQNLENLWRPALPWKYLTLIYLGLPLGYYLTAANFANRRHSYQDYDYGANILKTLPANALLFAQGDFAVFPLTYLIGVEGRRADVTVIDRWGTTFQDFYHYYQYPASESGPVQEKTEKELLQAEYPTRPAFFTELPAYDYPGYQWALRGILYQPVAAPPQHWPPPVIRFYRERGLSHSGVDLMSREMTLTYLEKLRQNQPPGLRAEDLRAKIRTLGERDMGYHNQVGIDAYGRGDYQAAAAEFTKALQLQPLNADIYYNLALAQLQLGDFRGEANLRKTLSLKPDYPGARELWEKIARKN